MPRILVVVVGLALSLALVWVVFRVLFQAREARPVGWRARHALEPGKRRRGPRRPRMY